MARGKVLLLTEQERHFARACVRLGHAGRAGREADVKKPYTLIKKPAVAAEIARLRAQVDAKHDPILCADANEVREKVTWLMRHAVNDETQLRAAMVMVKLLGMTGEFNPGLALPADANAPRLPIVDTKGYTTMSRAELRAEAQGVALKLLKSGGGDDG